MNCSFETYVKEGVQVLVISGDFDQEACSTFRAMLKGVRAHTDQEVLLDLQRVEYLDSSALGLVVSLYKEQGDRLVMVPSETVCNILCLTRLQDTFKLVKAVEAGIEAIQRR